MDFLLSQDQRLLQDMALDFAASKIAPHAMEWESRGEIPREFLKEAGTLGFGGLCVSEEFGGSGLSRLEAGLVLEALATACPSVAAFISIHNMCASMVADLATETFRQTWLSRLISFEAVASYCLTEPGSGSDAAALRTKAEQDGDSYRLTGTKAFISGGGFSDLHLVMCRTGGPGPKGISTFAVPAGTRGLSFGAQEKKMGWKAQPTAEVQLDGCSVPSENLLGQEGEGFSYAMKALDGGRLNIAACWLGGAQAAMNTALQYMGERSAFGKKLNRFQALQFRLADMEMRLQTSRVFLRHAAWMLDNADPTATVQCAMAKCIVTDASFEVANAALQLLGGYGYLADFGVEKLVRDLRAHQILEGTNEIMRTVVSRGLLEAEQ